MGFWSRISGHFSASATARGKIGAIAYAVGDIHGRLDLLNDLLGAIEADLASNAGKEAFIIFLGDLIDRGPDSAQVLQQLIDYRHPVAKMVFLGGNHEEILNDILAGKPDVLEDWLRYGGSECVRSYGLDPIALKRMNERQAVAMLRATMPQSHQGFIASMGDTFRFGDYLFVHAGIRPGVALEDQSRRDLRWIREPFLSDDCDHRLMVVHGHTVVEAVDERDNRIGIDTGAYFSGRLTALVVDGMKRRYITTGDC